MGRQFNVFIERARSSAPGAAAQLANAIAARYGIPAAEVERRLAVGRFRVKGGVDRATADTFANDLARLGAVVTIAPAEIEKPAPVAPVSLQQPRVAAPPKPSAFTSGLAAAAAAHDLEEPGLGALSGEFPLTLSTLDGADDDSVSSGSPASFGPPSSSSSSSSSFGAGAAPSFEMEVPQSDGIDVAMDDDDDRSDERNDDELDMAAALPASIGPAAGAVDLGGPAPRRPSTVPPPGDIFAPPEAAAELALALEVDDSSRAKKRSSAPPPVMAATAAAASEQESTAAPARRRISAAGWKEHARDPRVQYVAGVVLCAALGLLPASIIASVRERSAFAELDGKLQEREAQVLTRADWDGLDRVRAGFAERKRAERQSIAFTSLLLWAAMSGGLAYVWFRVIDWDRVLGD